MASCVRGVEDARSVCARDAAHVAATSPVLPPLLLVADFDGTLVSVDTDAAIMSAFDPPALVETSRAYAAGASWSALMTAVYAKAAAGGATRADIDAVLVGVPMWPEMVQLLRAASAHGVRVAILSDANEHAIETICGAYGVRDCVTCVGTNAARWSTDGALEVQPFTPPELAHGCSRCPRNMCKSAMLDALIAAWPHLPPRLTAEHVQCAQLELEGRVHRLQREQEQAPGGEGGESGTEDAHLEGVLACDRRRDGEVCKVALVAPLAAVGRDAERAEEDVAHVRPRVFYVGDGRNDVCPALHLKRCDVAAARDGFAMAKMLAAADPASIKAQVLVWDEPRVVLTHFLDTLSGLNASTASAAVPCVDASCVAAPASLSVPREA